MFTIFLIGVIIGILISILEYKTIDFDINKLDNYIFYTDNNIKYKFKKKII